MSVKRYFMPDRTFFVGVLVTAAEAFSAARFASAADIEGETFFRQMPAFDGDTHTGGDTGDRGKNRHREAHRAGE
jgi:hypothetical protein